MSLRLLPKPSPWQPPPQSLERGELCDWIREQMGPYMAGDFMLPLHTLPKLFGKSVNDLFNRIPDIAFEWMPVIMESGRVVDCIILSDLAAICQRYPELLNTFSVPNMEVAD